MEKQPPPPVDRWSVRHNDMFSREGRCLRFAPYTQALRDCRACCTIAWCRYYDHLATQQTDLIALARWEDDGGPPGLAA